MRKSKASKLFQPKSRSLIIRSADCWLKLEEDERKGERSWRLPRARVSQGGANEERARQERETRKAAATSGDGPKFAKFPIRLRDSRR